MTMIDHWGAREGQFGVLANKWQGHLFIIHAVINPHAPPAGQSTRRVSLEQDQRQRWQFIDRLTTDQKPVALSLLPPTLELKRFIRM